MKRLIIAAFALMLFASSLFIQGNVLEANASTPLLNYELYAGGGGSTPSIRWDGTKFTLTQNIEGTITIMDTGTVLDGAGFTVIGRGDSVGIAVYDKTNVTIRNVKVENFMVGILLGHYRSPDAFLWYDPNPNRCTNCTISNCQVSNNTIGIQIVGGIKCQITNNQATNNSKGITFSGTGNVFRGNRMANNDVNFDDPAGQGNDVDTSNIVDGKPIYYLANQQNITVQVDAGIVRLDNCQNITIKNLDIEHANKAIVLLNSSNCIISQNVLSYCTNGISLRDSANNSITCNELRNNSNDAIEQFDSENTLIANNLIRGNGGGIDSGGYAAKGSINATILRNQIVANGGCGIQAGTKSTVTENYIAGNGQYGIYFYDMSNSVMERNFVTNNKNSGLCFRIGKDVLIIGNDLTNNSAGIEMGDLDNVPTGCVVKENNFANNTNLAIQIYGDAKSNKFFLNNFINNNNGGVQASIKGRFVWHGDEGYDENSKIFPQYFASYNAWDNGSVGNYWSDLDLTVKATYRIDSTNLDRHPQTMPFQFIQPEIPQAGLETPISASDDDTSSSGSDVLALFAVAVGVVAAVGIVAFILIIRRKKK